MKTIKPISILLLSALTSVTTLTSQASETLDAHEHGSASLNIAIADNLIAIQFESPAANIVGFEYTPNTEEQKAIVAEAKRLLSDFDTGFKLQGDPECAVLHSSAQWVSEHHDHEHEEHEEHDDDHDGHDDHDDDHDGHDDHDDDHDGHDDHDDDHDGHDDDDTLEAEHSEFQVEFELQCEQINNLSAIDVELFKVFSDINDIDAQVIYSAGQIKQELGKGDSRINLNN